MGAKWDQWASPLRPSVEDVALFRKRMQQRILLVGYTPELVGMASHVVDIRSPEVINSPDLDVFLDTGGTFITSDWFSLGEKNIGDFDVIMGDGSLVIVGNVGSDPVPTTIFDIFRKKLTKEREAKMVFRVYLKTLPQEPLGKILLTKGENINEFKWRLAMCMASPQGFVKLGDLAEALKMHWPGADISHYAANPDGSYWFPTFDQLPYQGRISDVDVPTSYPLASRCPVVTWTF